MKTTSITLKQYLKFILLTSPLFFVATFLFNYVISQYSISNIRDQHARDIALNIGIAQRIASGYQVNSSKKEDEYKNILTVIANNFSRMPGVGCVVINVDEIVIHSPPKIFCEKINITGTVSSGFSERAKVTFLLNDKYLIHLERSAKLSTLYLNLMLLIVFVILNYGGFHLTYKKQIDYLFVKNRRLFDQSPIPLVRVSTTGLILEASAAWEEVFGDKQDTNIVNYITEWDRKKFEALLKNTIREGSSRVEKFSLTSWEGTEFICALKLE